MRRAALALAAVLAAPLAGATPPITSPETDTALTGTACGEKGAAFTACVPACKPGQSPTAGALCLRAEDLIEMRGGRRVSSRVTLERDCGADRSTSSPRVVVTDGLQGRWAKSISLWLRYGSEASPARIKTCASALECKLEDSRPGNCRPMCAGGTWQTLDGRTIAIPQACDPA